MEKHHHFFNVERARQIYDFHGLEYERKITPTDFDMVIDFGGKEWVVGEFKMEGTNVPYGQKLALTSALKAHWDSGIKPLGIIAHHNTPIGEFVVVATMLVSEVWINPTEGWRQAKSSKTVREAIDSWRRWNKNSDRP
jgi:hypothetical protein